MIPIMDTKSGNTTLAIRNSTFGLLSLGCRLVGNMAVFIVIARLPGIGASEFGQLTYAAALTALFVMLSQFGLLPLLVRDIAADHSRLTSYARSALSLRIVLSLLGLAVMALYVQKINMTGQARLVCYIIAAAFYIGSFSADLQALFQGRERMHLELFGIVTENVLLLVLALLAFLFHPTIVQVACIFLLAKSAALVFNYLICGRFLLWMYPRVDIGLWKRMLVEATPFALAGIIAMGVVQIDTVLMRELAPGDSESVVGLYQAAIRLFLVPMLLPQIVLKVFLPQLSRMHGRQGRGLTRDLGRVNHILLTLGLLIGLVTVFRGSDLIRLFYGGKYADAGPLLQILGITIMMRFGAAYNLYFTIRNRIWFRVFSALLALTAIVTYDCILIPRYGPIGAAYASVLAHIVYWIPYLIALYMAERTLALGWKFFRAAGAACLLITILYLTSELHVLYMLPIYTLLVLAATFWTMPQEVRDRIRSQFNFKGS